MKNKLPDFGKWLLKADGNVSNWLGYMINGKHIQEPLNIIFEDSYASSTEIAEKHILDALKKATYPVRFGHSIGYQAEIEKKLYPQLPHQTFHAFSDTFYFLNNNHGRIFGPCLYQNRYYFVGAFSRELISPFTKIKHVYGSFNRARDDVAQKLDSKTDFKIKEYVSLDNCFINDPHYTTGDHDGMAALLQKF